MTARQVVRTLVAIAAMTAGAAASESPVSPSNERFLADRFRDDLLSTLALIDSRPAQPGPVLDTAALESMAVPSHGSIERALQYFKSDLHDKIQLSLYRSSEYNSMIDQILAEYGLPSALAYLPVIESAYVPTVTSRAGARGIWQFVPLTAKEYGLRVDWWVDERADPEESTRAAASYLRDLHDAFGDWPLALAAYNAGPGRVRRAMERSGEKSFWQLLDRGLLPKETRGYVSTFFATLLIAGDPESHGFTLNPPLENEVAAVLVEGPLSLDYVASVIETDPAILRGWNPSLHHGVAPPGVQSIRVPNRHADSIRARASELRFEDPLVPAALYTVNRGDSISSLAKRLRLDRSSIRAMNGLSGDTVKVGTSIYLPITQIELSRRLTESPGRTSQGYYIVAPGDTLSSIARAHGLTIEEIFDLNRLRPDSVIHPGDRIRVSLQAGVAAGAM